MLMQLEHKLNGFPYKEFEKIGINKKDLYNLRRNNSYKDRKLLNITFNNHFGCSSKGTKKERLIFHYFSHIYKLNDYKHYQRAERLNQIRDHLYNTGRLFGISLRDIDDVWEELMNIHLVI